MAFPVAINYDAPGCGLTTVITNYQRLKERVLFLFELFCDTEPPKARAWSGKTGGAAKLAKDFDKIVQLADALANGQRIPSKITGWTQFAAAALALERILRDDRVKSIVAHLLEVAQSNNELAHKRDFARRKCECEALGEPVPQQHEVPRRDMQCEKTLTLVHAYLVSNDVYGAVHGVCHFLALAVANSDTPDVVVPVYKAFGSLSKIHPWRTTRKQQREMDSRNVCRDQQEEEDGLWDLEPFAFSTR